MKAEEIDGLTEEEAKDRLKKFYQSPYIAPYFSVAKQLEKLSEEIENADISIEEKTFDSFIKWGEKSLIISDNLQVIQSKIDADVLAGEKEKRLSAKSGSVESRRRNA